MAKFEKYSRWCYAELISGTPRTDGFLSILSIAVQNCGAATPHSPLWAPVARNGTQRVRDGRRGLLQLPPHLPPQPPHLFLNGLR